MSTARGRSLPLLLVAGLGAAIGLALRWVDVVAVRGRSMAPTLLPGDRLLVARLGRPPRAGEIVLTSDPRQAGRELIKRVAAIHDGRVTLRGDGGAAASTDSRTFGTLPADAIGWRAVARYWPPARAGLLSRPPPARLLEHVDEGGETACTFPEALVAGE